MRDIRFFGIVVLLVAGKLFANEPLDSVFHKIKTNQIDYHTFSARTKCSWTDANGRVDFQASFRLVKDSVIWGSITGPVGMEISRFLITPDSFRLLSSLTKEYLVKDISYVRNWLSLPLNFAQLQQILSGQLLELPDAAFSLSQTDSTETRLYFENNTAQLSHSLNLANYTVSTSLLKDKLLDQSLQANFESMDSVSEKAFSFKRQLVMKRGSAQMSLQLEFVKVAVNEEVNLPFDIHAGYKRVE